jgi:hypothetical protein
VSFLLAISAGSQHPPETPMITMNSSPWLANPERKLLRAGAFMPLFVCPKCGCIDNTALSGYWTDKHLEGIDKPFCTLCKNGKWHNHFPHEKAPETLDENYVEVMYANGDITMELSKNLDEAVNIAPTMTPDQVEKIKNQIRTERLRKRKRNRR